MTTPAAPQDERRTSVHRNPKSSIRGASDRRVKIVATPEHPLIISASELRDFLRCRVRWNWRHHLRLEPVGGKTALSMGTLVHDILETWYLRPLEKRGVKAMERITREKVQATTLDALSTEDLELITAMTVGYAAWAKTADQEIGLHACTPEEWFELPVSADGSIIIRGRLDNTFVPTNMKKTVACQETKTASQFRDNQLDTLTQLSVYLWAMRAKYPTMKRYVAYYTQLRKQLPGPRVRAPLFDRSDAVERTDAEIDMWIEDVQRTARDMLDAAIYPNYTKDCGWDCDFKNACALRGSPADLQHVLTHEFKQKEHR